MAKQKSNKTKVVSYSKIINDQKIILLLLPIMTLPDEKTDSDVNLEIPYLFSCSSCGNDK